MAAALEKRDNTNELQAPTRMACSVIFFVKERPPEPWLRGKGCVLYAGRIAAQAICQGRIMRGKSSRIVVFFESIYRLLVGIHRT